MVERESLYFDYHPNCVMLLHNTDIHERIVLKSLPNYEKIEEHFGTAKTVRGGVLFMKYYISDLSNYLKRRVRFSSPFENIELLYILLGLLRGGEHLFKNKIVHRDLHLGNVFVIPREGRILIGDYGCCLNLRSREEKGFKVLKSDPILVSGDGYVGGEEIEGEDEEDGRYFKNGGCKKFLPPEIMDTKENYYDYLKTDIFSIGTIMYTLICSFSKDGNINPHGGESNRLDRNPKIYGRVKEDYIKIPSDLCDPKISNLVDRMLLVSMKERINFGKAIDEVENLVKVYEEKEFKSNIRDFENYSFLMNNTYDMSVFLMKKYLEKKTEKSNIIVKTLSTKTFPWFVKKLKNPITSIWKKISVEEKTEEDKIKKNEITASNEVNFQNYRLNAIDSIVQQYYGDFEEMLYCDEDSFFAGEYTVPNKELIGLVMASFLDSVSTSTKVEDPKK